MYPRCSNTGVHGLRESRSGVIETVTRQADIATSIACDYLTCTASEGDSPSPLHRAATACFQSEADRGNRVYGWGVSGFKGYKCGDIEIGKKPGRVIVRLVSTWADSHWRKFVPLSDNITRIDLQATILSKESVTERIEECRRAALDHAARLHEKPVVRWTADNRGGYTLYLGSRESNVFGRIYDKYAHTLDERYEGCIRFEVQFQKSLAKSIAFVLARQSSPKSLMAQYISQFFAGRDMLLELPYFCDNRYGLHRRRSDVESNLEWLRSAVAPMVQRLIDSGHGLEVFESLGLIKDSACSQKNPQAHADNT